MKLWVQCNSWITISRYVVIGFVRQGYWNLKNVKDSIFIDISFNSFQRLQQNAWLQWLQLLSFCVSFFCWTLEYKLSFLRSLSRHRNKVKISWVLTSLCICCTVPESINTVFTWISTVALFKFLVFRMQSLFGGGILYKIMKVVIDKELMQIEWIRYPPYERSMIIPKGRGS